MKDLNLCLWRDLFLGRESGDYQYTTFMNYLEWDKTHPLFKCTECNGIEHSCNGYAPLDPVARIEIIRGRNAKKA